MKKAFPQLTSWVNEEFTPDQHLHDPTSLGLQNRANHILTNTRQWKFLSLYRAFFNPSLLPVGERRPFATLRPTSNANRTCRPISPEIPAKISTHICPPFLQPFPANFREVLGGPQTWKKFNPSPNCLIIKSRINWQFRALIISAKPITNVRTERRKEIEQIQSYWLPPEQNFLNLSRERIAGASVTRPVSIRNFKQGRAQAVHVIGVNARVTT